jgi:outer membrane immunogenic protein
MMCLGSNQPRGIVMKRLILGMAAFIAVSAGGPALAADMPVKARPLPPPVPVFSWTGFYFGGHVGGAWGTTESTLNSLTITQCIGGQCSPPDPIGGFSIPISQTQTNGFLGGVQGGYNWDFGWGVFGVEAQFSWTDLKGTSPCALVIACSTDHDWITTFAGRFGVTYDRLLLYVKGGVAWSKVTYSANLNLDGLINASTSVSDTRFGPMFGAGLEYAFWGNWSAKIEYNYIDFRNEDYNFLASVPLGGSTVPITINLDFGTTIHERVHLIKAGLNYRFDWGKYPVAVRAAY